MKAKVSKRSQVTIPQALRKKLGIRPGMFLDFQIQNHKLIAVKVQSTDPVTQVFGCLKIKYFHTDEFMKDIRGK